MPDSNLPQNLREFHCSHCNGKIRIPRDLPPTTGPCPHCQGIITSPAPESSPPASLIPPAPAPTYAPPPQQSAPIVAPIPSAPQPGAPQPAPEPLPAQTPLQSPGPEPVAAVPQQAAPPVDPAPPAEPQPAPSPKEPLRQRRSSSSTPPPAEPKKSIVPVLFLIVLLAAFAGAAGYVVYKEMKNRETASNIPVTPSPATSERAENQYIRIGWQNEARSVLGKFLAAKTVAEKVPYVLNGEKLRHQMEAFYGGSVINDLDTPEEAFSIFELSESDRRRGIFLLSFDQPPQFEMKEFFRPLATIEVQYGIDDADILLSTLANVANFASEPIRVSAFFKKTPEGLKLDWEVFAQTKYRTLETMFEVPEAGQGGIFRVLIEEDVPVKGTESNEYKTYRVSDPSSPRTSARIMVKIDSPIGRSLSEINWLGQQNRPIIRTATIELRWVGADKPVLEIGKFVCWEFLNLGGEISPAPPAQ